MFVSGQTFPTNLYATGVPNAPVDLTSSALSATSLLLSWSSPPTSDTSCPPATYSITIGPGSSPTNPVVINTKDAKTITIVSGLSQGLGYYFFVAGVDAG